MLVPFLNIRGITAPGSKKCLADTIIPLKVDYIGFQETNKENFTKSFLKNILGNENFEWNLVPACGTIGGILVGVNSDVFEVISWEMKILSITIVKIKSSGVTIRLTTMYGSPYEEGK
jgi:hypothetical protein